MLLDDPILTAARTDKVELIETKPAALKRLQVDVPALNERHELQSK
jgi:hypothetical protein